MQRSIKIFEMFFFISSIWVRYHFFRVKKTSRKSDVQTQPWHTFIFPTLICSSIFFMIFCSLATCPTNGCGAFLRTVFWEWHRCDSCERCLPHRDRRLIQFKVLHEIHMYVVTFQFQFDVAHLVFPRVFTLRTSLDQKRNQPPPGFMRRSLTFRVSCAENAWSHLLREQSYNQGWGETYTQWLIDEVWCVILLIRRNTRVFNASQLLSQSFIDRCVG